MFTPYLRKLSQLILIVLISSTNINLNNTFLFTFIQTYYYIKY